MAPRVVACDECLGHCKMYHQNQNAQSPMIARFVKILYWKDYSKVLHVPPQFVSKLKHLVNQQFQFKDSCGEQWSVTLSKDGDGSLVFRKGWNKFVQDHNLVKGEFLVFNYMKGKDFIVQIYGKSACEKINFTSRGAPRNKRSRRDTETDSESERDEGTNRNLRHKPNSGSFQNSQKHLVVDNADFEGLQFRSRSNDMEDPNCIIIRDEWNQREDMNILYDLSIFEMGNTRKHANKFGKAIDARVASSNGGSAKQSKTEGSGTEMPVILANLVVGDASSGKFNKGLGTICGHSQTEILEQCKTMIHDNPITAGLSDGNGGTSAEVFSTKFEKDSDSKTPPCAEVTGRTKTKIDVPEKAVVRTDSVNGHSGSIVSDRFPTKPPDHSKLSKGKPTNIFHDGSHKIAGRENTAKHQGLNSSTSSMLKNSIGMHSVKKELAELKQEATSFSGSFCVKEPNTAWKHNQTVSPVVKIEPDLSCDTIPLASFSPFTAEVKNLSFLELPMSLPSVFGRRERGRIKVVYVKDSYGRTLPMHYPDAGLKWVLSGNWRTFCEHNNIKIGDTCRVEADNDMVRISRIDVAHGSGDDLATK